MTPLYLSDLQKRISSLPESERQTIRLLVIVNEKDEHRKLVFDIPKGGRLEAEEDLNAD